MNTIVILCLLALIGATAVSGQKASEVAAEFERQLQQEESVTPVIYEIEMLHWKNPLGKTFTGRRCNETAKQPPFTCDPEFLYNVEVLRNRTKPIEGAHIIANQTCMTWPGKTPLTQWQLIGKEDYDDVDQVEKIGIIRLAPVPEGELQDVILRLAVMDRYIPRDYKNAIGYFMCILPGTSNGRYMKVKPTELRSESLWSGPMHCFPAAHFDRFLAPYIEFESQNEQELIVRFRAYRENDNKDTAAEKQQTEVEQQRGGRNYRHYRNYRNYH